MLAPGGAFLHNEQRPIIGDLAAAMGLPLQQSRHAVIATVTGAKAPLYDSVFLHVRGRGARPERLAGVDQSRADPSVSVTIRFASTSRHVSSRPFGHRTTTRSALAAPASPTWTRRSFCEK